MLEPTDPSTLLQSDRDNGRNSSFLMDPMSKAIRKKGNRNLSNASASRKNMTQQMKISVSPTKVKE